MVNIMVDIYAFLSSFLTVGRITDSYHIIIVTFFCNSYFSLSSHYLRTFSRRRTGHTFCSQISGKIEIIEILPTSNMYPNVYCVAKGSTHLFMHSRTYVTNKKLWTARIVFLQRLSTGTRLYILRFFTCYKMLTYHYFSIKFQVDRL